MRSNEFFPTFQLPSQYCNWLAHGSDITQPSIIQRLSKAIYISTIPYFFFLFLFLFILFILFIIIIFSFLFSTSKSDLIQNILDDATSPSISITNLIPVSKCLASYCNVKNKVKITFGCGCISLAWLILDQFFPLSDHWQCQYSCKD